MDSSAENNHTAKPHINVTPLIDVLLVLLIIFMVVTPLKPARIAAKVPSKPDHTVHVDPNIKTLLVTIKRDRTLMLNGLTNMGSIEDMSKLSDTLADLFQKRRQNHLYRDEMMLRTDVPEDLRIERTVFIKAPRSISYGEVARVVDGVKGSGASPLGLAIYDLD
ncbi:MAG: biopolymer transport protein ExbD [Blastocatellia bacterium]|jgi:biopolymer transport protein ExbD|nr:biopolymer transport protein ExbD [Blastocatellia bacterium]